eukprot:353530-Chlamydomonas_euryale.AAC.6
MQGCHLQGKGRLAACRPRHADSPAHTLRRADGPPLRHAPPVGVRPQRLGGGSRGLACDVAAITWPQQSRRHAFCVRSWAQWLCMEHSFAVWREAKCVGSLGRLAAIDHGAQV